MWGCCLQPGNYRQFYISDCWAEVKRTPAALTGMNGRAACPGWALGHSWVPKDTAEEKGAAGSKRGRGKCKLGQSRKKSHPDPGEEMVLLQVMASSALLAEIPSSTSRHLCLHEAQLPDRFKPPPNTCKLFAFLENLGSCSPGALARWIILLLLVKGSSLNIISTARKSR